MPEKKKIVKKVVKKVVKKKKKPKKKPYFGLDVQDAIVRYNASNSDSERNKIYGQEIHKAFDKLAENIINTFKFSYFDYGFTEIKNEVVGFLVMNMHKYDHTKGSKAFSYFSIVAKNYLILHNNNNYKKLKTHSELAVLDRSSYIGKTYVEKEQDEDLKDFSNQLRLYFEKNITSMFKKKRDIDIAYAITELIHKIDEIETFNKKALYLFIREMTGVNTSHITKIVNEMKKHYSILQQEYATSGSIDLDKIGGKGGKKFF